jgi:integrase/recombinase XerD
MVRRRQLAYRSAAIITGTGKKRYMLVNRSGTPIEPVNRFLRHLDNAGRARNTLRSYCIALGLYLTYLDHRGADWRSADLEIRGEFVRWLRDPATLQADAVASITPRQQMRSNETINVYLGAVTLFYDFAHRALLTPTNLNEHVREAGRRTRYKDFLHGIAASEPKERDSLRQAYSRPARPKTIPKADIERLIGCCQRWRDRALLRLLYESGIRIGEALSLWLEDIELSGRVSVVDRGELGNDAEIKSVAANRVVDISQDTTNAILDYLARESVPEVETNHVFVKLHGPHRGQPMDYSDVHALFRRLRTRTGIQAWPHLLRHSSLTALARTWRPEELQRRAGHRHFNTTYTMYVHPNDDDLRARWEQTQRELALTNAKGGHS